MRLVGPTRLILAGESGCGKTRVCGAVANELRDRGWDIAGVLSPGVWVGDRKVAIDALDLRSGTTRRLAERAGMSDGATGPATPGWRFHAATLAWCNSLLANAGDPDLLAVDELGPLELEQEEGLLQGLLAVDTGRFRVALVVVRPRLLPMVQSRWPEARILAMHDPTGIPAQTREILSLAHPREAAVR